MLRRLATEHRLALRHRLPVDVVRAQRAEAAQKRAISRRELLLAGAAVSALPWVPGCGGESQSEPTKVKVAIVGAGIAGLSAALTLEDKGYEATVYDISKHRVGGRMVTERGSEPTGCNSCHEAPASAPKMSWADGQVTDIYGELVDSGHTTIQALAKRFQLELTDALGAQPAGSKETWWFGGGYYEQTVADVDFAAIYDALQKDAEDAGWPVTYDTANAAAKALDAMSIYDWIETRVPGGNASKLGSLLNAVYVMEYGAEAADQSALNLISMLSGSPQALEVLGESDEKYRIKGGVDQLPRKIADHLGVDKVVRLGHNFQALKQESDGTYTLSFDTDSGPLDVRADYVILALPFSALRTRDLRKAGFDELKMRAINEQGAGRNVKIQLQFTKRLWNEQGPWGVSTGTCYGDTGFQLAWDPTRGQPGKAGILVGYNGGDAAAAVKLSHPYGNKGDPHVVTDAKVYLSQMEPLFPGLTALWNGNVAESKPHIDPRFNCSYAYYRVGQTQAFAGYERVRQGNVFFCGEHTSLENLGFMEGAASEGIAAAEELIAAMGKA
jgi:monoamine oxidase